MTAATPLYRAVMIEVERRRQQLGWPMWKVDEASGVQDGYYAKMLHPDTPSGRQAQWGTLQLVVEALFPGGFDVAIKPQPGGNLSALQLRSRIKAAASLFDRKLQRELMAEIGRLGGAKSGAARMRRITRAKRVAIAKRAGRAKRKRGMHRDAVSSESTAEHRRNPAAIRL